MSRSSKAGAHRERYELSQSPLAQRLTQRKLAKLLKVTRSELRRLVAEKEKHVVRRDVLAGGKLRHLAYPTGRFRALHERLRFHCEKVRQPAYLMSPRSGRGQRDNALVHLSGNHFLILDIKQFYPSTSTDMVRGWCKSRLGMPCDVASLFTRIVTVDERLSFGSPLTPILAALLHRELFDAIYAECHARGLKMSLWVDDIVISGQFVTGDLLGVIREIVRQKGLRSHKVLFRTSSRPVIVTGVPIYESAIVAPRSLHERIIVCYRELAKCDDPDTFESVSSRLLSALGTYRYVVGPKSIGGRRAAARMASVRRRRLKVQLKRQAQPLSDALSSRLFFQQEHPAPF